MLADAAWIVIDQMGRAAKFVGDLTAASLYAAKMHGQIKGPFSVARADAIITTLAAGIYGTRPNPVQNSTRPPDVSSGST